MGRTAGEAVDALTAQLPAEELDTLIVVRGLRSDRFFSEVQRLEQPMASWRAARDAPDRCPRMSSPSWKA
jgi:hypothetical protein